MVKKKAKAKKKRATPMHLDTKLKPEPEAVKGYVEAQQEEMDDLYDLFEVHEANDIDEILDGSIGVSEF